jgi:hypothetical protein
LQVDVSRYYFELDDQGAGPVSRRPVVCPVYTESISTLIPAQDISAHQNITPSIERSAKWLVVSKISFPPAHRLYDLKGSGRWYAKLQYNNVATGGTPVEWVSIPALMPRELAALIGNRSSTSRSRRAPRMCSLDMLKSKGIGIQQMIRYQDSLCYPVFPMVISATTIRELVRCWCLQHGGVRLVHAEHKVDTRNNIGGFPVHDDIISSVE